MIHLFTKFALVDRMLLCKDRVLQWEEGLCGKRIGHLLE